MMLGPFLMTGDMMTYPLPAPDQVLAWLATYYYTGGKTDDLEQKEVTHAGPNVEINGGDLVEFVGELLLTAGKDFGSWLHDNETGNQLRACDDCGRITLASDTPDWPNGKCPDCETSVFFLLHRAVEEGLIRQHIDSVQKMNYELRTTPFSGIEFFYDPARDTVEGAWRTVDGEDLTPADFIGQLAEALDEDPLEHLLAFNPVAVYAEVEPEALHDTDEIPTVDIEVKVEDVIAKDGPDAVKMRVYDLEGGDTMLVTLTSYGVRTEVFDKDGERLSSSLVDPGDHALLTRKAEEVL
jgi:hypothetical protein